MSDSIERLIRDKAEIDVRVKVVLEALTDKSIPLEVRWENYVKLCNASLITKIESYGDGYIDILMGAGKGSCYDDFYMERHESREYLDLYDLISNPEDYRQFEEVTKDNLDAWKEKVLASGYAGFKHDW